MIGECADASLLTSHAPSHSDEAPRADGAPSAGPSALGPTSGGGELEHWAPSASDAAVVDPRGGDCWPPASGRGFCCNPPAAPICGCGCGWGRGSGA